MLVEIAQIFDRDLKKLIEEIKPYENEEDIWKIKPGISNSGGNLVLHLIGNLNYFIGTTLGNTGFIRERDKEFSLSNIPKEKMVGDLKNTIKVIKKTLPSLPESELYKDFPVAINNQVTSLAFVLLHLLAHLSYHLGQVNYHRRLIS